MTDIYSRFRRITSGSAWIPEVDGLRFVAVMAVLLYHLNSQVLIKSYRAFTFRASYQPILVCISNGSRGVEIFFVISGFILGRPFAREALAGGSIVSIPSYFLRRLTRLEPPYIFNLVAVAICGYIYRPISPIYLLRHVVASCLYLHGFIYKSASTVNGVAWTLEVEAQFYLLVPILVAIYRIPSRFVRRAVIVAAVLSFAAIQELFFAKSYWGLLSMSVVPWLQYFTAGLLLSDLYVLDFPSMRPSYLWDVVSLVTWPAIFYFDAWWRPSVLPFLIFLVFIAAFHGIASNRLFRMTPMAIIGGMCYSIYLWHFFFIALLFKLTRRVSFFDDYLLNLSLQAVLLVIPVLCCCAVLYLLIERPCMDPMWPGSLRKTASGWSRACAMQVQRLIQRSH